MEQWKPVLLQCMKFFSPDVNSLTQVREEKFVESLFEELCPERKRLSRWSDLLDFVHLEYPNFKELTESCESDVVTLSLLLLHGMVLKPCEKLQKHAGSLKPNHQNYVKEFLESTMAFQQKVTYNQIEQAIHMIEPAKSEECRTPETKTTTSASASATPLRDFLNSPAAARARRDVRVEVSRFREEILEEIIEEREKLSSKVDELNQKNKDLERAMAEKRTEIASLNEELESAQRDIEEAKRKHANAEDEAFKKEDEIVGLNRTIKKLVEDLEISQRASDNKNSEISNLEKENEKLRALSNRCTDEIEALRLKADKYWADKNVLMDRCAMLERRLEEVECPSPCGKWPAEKREGDTLASEMVSFQLEEQTHKIRELEDELKSSRDKISQLQESLQTAEERCCEQVQKFTEMEKKHTKLGTDFSATVMNFVAELQTTNDERNKLRANFEEERKELNTQINDLTRLTQVTDCKLRIQQKEFDLEKSRLVAQKEELTARITQKEEQLVQKNCELAEAEEKLCLQSSKLTEAEEEIRFKNSKLTEAEEEIRLKDSKLMEAAEKMRLNESKLAEAVEEILLKDMNLTEANDELRLKNNKLMEAEEEIRLKNIKLAEEEEVIRLKNTKLTEAEEEIRLKNSKLMKAEEEIRNRNSKLTEAEEEIRLRDSKLSEAEEEIRLKNSKLTELEEELCVKNSKLTEAEEEIRLKNSKLAESEEEICLKDKRLAEAEEEIRRKVEKLTDTEEKIRRKDSKLSELEEELCFKNNKLTEAEKEIRLKNDKLVEAEEELSLTNRKLTDAEEEIRVNNEKVADTEEEIRLKNKQLTVVQKDIVLKDARLAQLEDINLAKDKEIVLKDLKLLQKEEEVALKDAVISEREIEVSEKATIIEEKNSIISEKSAIIEEKKSIISDKDRIIAEKNSIIAEKVRVIEERDEDAARKALLINEREREISDLKEEIAKLQEELDDAKLEAEESLETQTSLFSDLSKSRSLNESLEARVNGFVKDEAALKAVLPGADDSSVVYRVQLLIAELKRSEDALSQRSNELEECKVHLKRAEEASSCTASKSKLQLKRSEEDLNLCSRELEKCRQQLKRSEEALSLRSSELEECKLQSQRSKEALNVCSSEVETLRLQLKTIEAGKQELEKSNKELSSEIEKLHLGVRAYEDQIQSLKNTVSQKDSAFEQIAKERDELKKTFIEVEKNMKDAAANRFNLESEVVELLSKVEALEIQKTSNEEILQKHLKTDKAIADLQGSLDAVITQQKTEVQNHLTRLRSWLDRVTDSCDSLTRSLPGSCTAVFEVNSTKRDIEQMLRSVDDKYVNCLTSTIRCSDCILKLTVGSDNGAGDCTQGVLQDKEQLESDLSAVRALMTELVGDVRDVISRCKFLVDRCDFFMDEQARQILKVKTSLTRESPDGGTKTEKETTVVKMEPNIKVENDDFETKYKELQAAHNDLQISYKNLETELKEVKENFAMKNEDHIHKHYAAKLETLKIKMDQICTAEINKIQEGRDRAERQMIAQHEKIVAEYRSHVQSQASQVWELNEKLIQKEQEVKALQVKLSKLQDKLFEGCNPPRAAAADPSQNIRHSLSVDWLDRMGQDDVPLISRSRPDRQSLCDRKRPDPPAKPKRAVLGTSMGRIEEGAPNSSRAAASGNSVMAPASMGVAFPEEDEDGELFNNTYLADMKSGRSRLNEFQQRNSMCPPHLKSSYPGETQFHDPKLLNEDEIKVSHDGRRLTKDRTQGKEETKQVTPRAVLQEPNRQSSGSLMNILRPGKTTPSRLRALFTSSKVGAAATTAPTHFKGDENEAPLTPTSKRMSIFRKRFGPREPPPNSSFTTYR